MNGEHAVRPTSADEPPGGAVPAAVPDVSGAAPVPDEAEDVAAAGRRGRDTGFAAALRIREFRSLWIADTASVMGTQISRVCLSLIVFDRTGSATATALVYALTFLPTLVGGALLSGVADRFSRKTVMIGSDLLRAALFAVMALPMLGLWITGTLLVIAVLLDSPFRAAQTATLPDVLPGDTYSAGVALRTISLQAAQLAGYALGGLLAAVVSPRFGLAVDAVTFLLSALLLWRDVQSRPVPARERRRSGATADYLHGVVAAMRLIVGSPKLRLLAGLAVLSGFYVVPEGLAAPYAAAIGGSSVAVGLLMAADPAGSAFGAWLLVKLLPADARARWMAVLAIGPGLILLVLLVRPGLVLSLTIWFVAGLVSVFHVPASVEFVNSLPDNQRGQALGLVISAMLTAQGLGVLLAGVVASRTDPTVAIVVFGGLGALVAAYLAVRWRVVRGTTAPATAVGPAAASDAS